MSKKRLFATDLDGTFIGDDAAMLALWHQLQERDLILSFSTGRHLRSIKEFYTEKKFPGQAEVCICMVGTDIHFLTEHGYQLDQAWHSVISEGWDKEAVERILSGIPEAFMQDAQWQSPFKSSYYLEDKVEEGLKKINQQLECAGLCAKVVYSAGKFLDLLPIRSGKGEAVKFVAQKLGVEPCDVVTCGDTGNDIDMMRTELGFRSITVGNATSELKAFKSERVYHAKNNFAAGIQEGLEAYGWINSEIVTST